jgi:uncharacterized protein (DUF952 family)
MSDEMSDRPAVAYKILTGAQMALLEHEGEFAGAPVDLADGYIHLSTAEQLSETVTKHFAGQDDLQLVAVDLAVLGDAMKWELSRGGQLFPHIYAPLPLSATLAYGPLERAPDGTVALPVAG